MSTVLTRRRLLAGTARLAGTAGAGRQFREPDTITGLLHEHEYPQRLQWGARDSGTAQGCGVMRSS